MASPAASPFRSAGTGGSRIVWTQDTLTPRLNELPKKLDRAIGVYMQYKSRGIQDHMRTSAPWNDRTGNARNGLFANYESGGGGFAGQGGSNHAIVMYHTVPYGIWLEVRWSGKYAVIVPTLQTKGPEVMAGISGLMGRMGYA